MQDTVSRPRRHLRVAPESGIPEPDSRATIAAALLGRHFPVEPVVEDEMAAFLGDDPARLDEIQHDSRYLIGRLTQALSMLLAGEVPSMDATSELLADAIGTAVHAVQSAATECSCGDECSQCSAASQQAQLYKTLFGQLGLIGDMPPQRLKAVR